MTNPAGEIAQRLRNQYHAYPDRGKEIAELTAKLIEAEARITRLDDALKPFAMLYSMRTDKTIAFVELVNRETNCRVALTTEAFDCAAAALVANAMEAKLAQADEDERELAARAEMQSILLNSEIDDLTARFSAANKLLEEAAGTLDLWREIPLARDTLAAINAHLAGVKKGEG